jgi:hypothetical protein
VITLPSWADVLKIARDGKDPRTEDPVGLDESGGVVLSHDTATHAL